MHNLYDFVHVSPKKQAVHFPYFLSMFGTPDLRQTTEEQVAKPRHTRACAQATFACALAFACRNCRVRKSQHAIERRKRLNSNESTS